MSGGREDWAAGPAKWFAVVALSMIAGGAIMWAVVRGERTPTLIRSAAGESQALTVKPTGGATPEPAAVAHRAASIEAVPTKGGKPALAPSRKININSAPAAELDLLPGIGPALAQRIIDYRQTKGKFSSIEELDQIKGFGPKLMARVRPHVTVE